MIEGDGVVSCEHLIIWFITVEFYCVKFPAVLGWKVTRRNWKIDPYRWSKLHADYTRWKLCYITETWTNLSSYCVSQPVDGNVMWHTSTVLPFYEVDRKKVTKRTSLQHQQTNSKYSIQLISVGWIAMNSKSLRWQQVWHINLVFRSRSLQCLNTPSSSSYDWGIVPCRRVLSIEFLSIFNF